MHSTSGPCDKEDRKIRSVPPRVVDQPLDQHPRMTAVVARRVGAHRANAADAHMLPIDGPREVVSLRAGQQVSPLHQRKSTLMTQCPGSLPLGRVKFGEGLATQLLVQDGLRRIQDPFENGAFSRHNGWHLRIIRSADMNDRSFRARSTSSVRCGIQSSARDAP